MTFASLLGNLLFGANIAKEFMVSLILGASSSFFVIFAFVVFADTTVTTRESS